MITRRQFNRGLVVSALGGLATHVGAFSGFPLKTAKGYGSLRADPEGILALPPGFTYTVISTLGETMDDGLPVPDRADGMGCFALDEERVILVRNHELQPQHATGELGEVDSVKAGKAYDHNGSGSPLPGGTSTLIYNLRTGQCEKQFMSLLGTIRNCAGGTTPWASWLTCEESVDTPSSRNNKEHGYVFEVPATNTGLTDAEPLKAMGRFNHEAACVDPNTGIVYMTEDRDDSLFYRFIPNERDNLAKGGRLQALRLKREAQFDTRNWQSRTMHMKVNYEVDWVDLEDVTSPNDDLRIQGYKKGAARFARGEGIIFGDNELYFCCTSGGAKRLGQIMRYSLHGDSPRLSLFLESEDAATFNYGDNLCVAPNGHLMVCEDQYTETVNNHLKGVTEAGTTYDFARVYLQTEPAGVCFSPDGSTMFVNLYSPTMTLAVTGPWSDA